MSGGFGGFNFGAPPNASAQAPTPASGFSFGSAFSSTQPSQPTQPTQQAQQPQSAPLFTFGAPSTNAPSSTNAGSTGSGFSFMGNQPTSGFGGFGQVAPSTAPTTTTATTTTTTVPPPASSAPTSAPISFSFGASTAPPSQSAQPTLQMPASTAQPTATPFTFGKPPDPTTADKAKEAQPSTLGGAPPVTDARLVELEGKKVSVILDNLYSILLKDLGTANKHAATLMTSEKDIELLEDMMKQFSSKLTHIQQKQFATEESLRKLYELQCDVLDIVKKMEDYSQYTTHPLTHAINTVENNLIALEQRITSSSVIDKEVLEVYQGLQRQISLIGMLEAAQ